LNNILDIILVWGTTRLSSLTPTPHSETDDFASGRNLLQLMYM